MIDFVELVNKADWYKPNGLPSDWDDRDYIVNEDQIKKFAYLVIENYSLLVRKIIDLHLCKDDSDEAEAIRDYLSTLEYDIFTELSKISIRLGSLKGYK